MSGQGISAFRLRDAARLLHAGGVIAYATEGVFGIGCDPGNPRAVARVIEAKGRSRTKGLILIAASEAQALAYAAPLDAPVLGAVRETWPGPVTWILPARRGLDPQITGGRDSVALRVTAHAGAAALCRAFGGALVSTSANLSGHPPARDALAARRWLTGRVDAVLPGRIGGHHGPSVIRDSRDGRTVRG